MLHLKRRRDTTISGREYHLLWQAYYVDNLVVMNYVYILVTSYDFTTEDCVLNTGTSCCFLLCSPVIFNKKSADCCTHSFPSDSVSMKHTGLFMTTVDGSAEQICTF